MRAIHIIIAVGVIGLCSCQTGMHTRVAGTYYLNTEHLCSQANHVSLDFTGNGNVRELGIAPGVLMEDESDFIWEREGRWSQKGSMVTVEFEDSERVTLRQGRYAGRECLTVYPLDSKLSRALQTRYIRVKESQSDSEGRGAAGADIETGMQHLPSRPNQALQPTATAVTPRADARVAPAAAVAEQ